MTTLPRGSAPSLRPAQPLLLAWAVGLLLRALRVGAETHAESKTEFYAEENKRVKVLSESLLFELAPAAPLTLRGSVVHDAISGATPDGGPARAGDRHIRLVSLDDARTAGAFEAALRLGRHTIRPKIAYSTESDYTSVTPSLNYVLDLNRRNTSLNLGVSHNFDSAIRGRYLVHSQSRDSTDFLAGLTQVLTPHTLWNATLTLGTASGYLSDPYKGFLFTDYGDLNSLFPERRPGHRTKQIVSTTLAEFIEPLDASVETTYRFYHDSFGLVGHTVTVEWLQNIGRRVVVAPLLRYYAQSAADFYQLSSQGDPSDVNQPNNVFIPQFYSSDYRLSHLSTLTYGVTVMARVWKRLWMDAAFKRYEMRGLDRRTAQDNYPKANIFTAGIRYRF